MLLGLIGAAVVVLVLLMLMGKGGGHDKPAPLPENAAQDAAAETLRKKLTEQRAPGGAYRRYAEAASRRYNAMVTPAAGPEPVPLTGDNGLYEVVRLANGNTVLSNPSARALLALRRHLLLRAPGGGGKSVFMRYLFLTGAASFLRHRSDEIPLLLESEHLRMIAAEETSVEDVIWKYMLTFEPEIDHESLTIDLRSGHFLLLLDGFDELSPQEAQKSAEKLQTFRTNSPGTACFAAARPGENERNPLRGFAPLELMPFSHGESVRLAKRLCAKMGKIEDFPRLLRDRYCDAYPEFTENPLLLSMFCLAYAEGEFTPQRPGLFFHAVFERLTSHWDAFHCRSMGREAFRRVFACFCNQTYFLAQTAFAVPDLPVLLEKSMNETGISGDTDALAADLHERLCFLIRDGRRFRFAHENIQTAFAALYDIREQPDEEQKPRFRHLLSDPAWERHDAYYNMLHQLEPERFASNVLADGLRDLQQRVEHAGEDPDTAFLKAMSVNVPWEYDTERNMVTPRADRRYGKNIRDAALVALFRKYIIGTNMSERRDNFNWQAVDPIFQRLPSLSTYDEADVQLTPAELRVFYRAAVQSERVTATREAIQKWLDTQKQKR